MKLKPHPRQAGFSMIEVLLAAFVLGVGILGVSMLQVLALRARRSSQNTATAVGIAQRILDQVEAEGRATWIARTDSQLSAAASQTKVATLMGTNTYVKGAHHTVDEQFAITGQPIEEEGATPEARTPIFTVATQQEFKSSGAGGGTSAFTVTVTFTENGALQADANPLTKTATLRRTVHHG